MNDNRQEVTSQELFPILLEMLGEGNKASFVITGMSMWPFLCDRRDKVVLEKCDWKDLKKGDAVLIQTPIGNYMFHRITDIKGDTFETTGDGNCFRDGYFSKECIRAKACNFIRKGKTITCDSVRWRSVFGIWNLLFPIRKVLLKLFRFIGNCKNRNSRDK